MINTRVQSTSKSVTISRDHDMLFLFPIIKKSIRMRAPEWKKRMFENGFILIYVWMEKWVLVQKHVNIRIQRKIEMTNNHLNGLSHPNVKPNNEHNCTDYSDMINTIH